MKRIRALGRRVLRAASELGPREIHFYVGLVIASLGGGLLSPAWMLVAIGVALAAVGYWGTRT